LISSIYVQTDLLKCFFFVVVFDCFAGFFLGDSLTSGAGLALDFVGTDTD
jgi:hypothetical protein